MIAAVEADPTHLLMAGGSAWVMLRPERSKLRLGVGAVTVQLPGALLGGGWGLRMSGLLGHVSWFPEYQGMYWGAYAGYWRDDWTLAGEASSATVHNVALIPALGYQWFPAGRGGLYVAPWIGLKLWLPLSGSPTVDGRSFPLPSALPLPGLNIGYQF